MTTEIDITEFLPATVWVTERGGRVFQSMGQFDWFRRRYRREPVSYTHLTLPTSDLV